VCEFLGFCSSAVEVFILMACRTMSLDISALEYEVAVLFGNASTNHPVIWGRIPEE
jgi:hypothetical protein